MNPNASKTRGVCVLIYLVSTSACNCSSMSSTDDVYCNKFCTCITYRDLPRGSYLPKYSTFTDPSTIDQDNSTISFSFAKRPNLVNVTKRATPHQSLRSSIDSSTL